MSTDPKLQLLEKSIRAVKMSSKTDTTTFSHLYYNFCYWLEDNNPFARYKHVSSTEEYMDMPRGERTFLWLWYRQ